MKKNSCIRVAQEEEIPQSLAENRRLSRSNPQSRACPECGSQERKLGVGKGPHSASLLCECGKFVKWVGKRELIALAAQLNKEGGSR